MAEWTSCTLHTSTHLNTHDEHGSEPTWNRQKGSTANKKLFLEHCLGCRWTVWSVTSAAAPWIWRRKGSADSGTPAGRHSDPHWVLLNQTQYIGNNSIAVMLKNIKVEKKRKIRQEQKKGRCERSRRKIISHCTGCYFSPFDKRPEQNLVKEGSKKRGLYVSDFFISTEISWAHVINSFLKNHRKN